MNIDRPFKVAAVREFLWHHYPPPGYAIADWYESDREAHMFRVTQQGAALYLLGASRELLDDNSAPRIAQLLDRQVIELLEEKKEIMLTTEGPRGVK